MALEEVDLLLLAGLQLQESGRDLLLSRLVRLLALAGGLEEDGGRGLDPLGGRRGPVEERIHELDADPVVHRLILVEQVLGLLPHPGKLALLRIEGGYLYLIVDL